MSANTSTHNQSISLEVLYFASLAEQAGKDSETITFDGDSLADLYQKLSDQYQFSLAQNKVAVAINHNMTRWHAPLSDGDIIAFIPPVAGG